MQQWLFLNSIFIGLRGKLESNGFIYATPSLVMVCLRVNEVLFGHNVNDTITVFPGNTRRLFLTISGIEICWMYKLCDAQSCHADNCAMDVYPKIKS